VLYSVITHIDKYTRNPNNLVDNYFFCIFIGMKEIKNTGQIIRSKKTGASRYTAISNEIIQSKTLSIEERGVLIYLLSLPEDWKIYKKNIWKQMNMGRDRFNKVWKALVEYGYIVSTKIFDTNSNLIVGYNHIVYEEPVLPSIGITENQDAREPVAIQSNKLQSNKLESNKLQNTNKELIEKKSPVDKFKEILHK
jgi:hypothetical protein